MNRWILALQEIRDPGLAIIGQDKLRTERTGAPIEMGNCDADGPYVIRSLKDLMESAKENDFQSEESWCEVVRETRMILLTAHGWRLFPATHAVIGRHQ